MNEVKLIQQQCAADSEDWFPDAANDLTVMALGIAGEAGEFADIVKKVARGSIALQSAVPDLREELTDVFIYVMNTAELLHVDLALEYVKKREINLRRFGGRD